MGSKLYPYFYFPTTLMFLDDSPEFLSSMSQTIQHKFPQVHFNAATNAIDYLVEKKSLHVRLNDFTSPKHVDDEMEDNHLIDYEAIQSLIYNPKRFGEIAAIVIDYSMPNMNGVNCCKNIEDLPVRKILLTGEAGYEIAVSAFNSGLIHSFVHKDSDSMCADIDAAIMKSTMNYFLELSKSIAGEYVTLHNRHAAYIRVVDQFMSDHKIIEYYQVDPFGSFLGFDLEGNSTWLIFSPEHEVLQYIDIAKSSAASTDVIHALGTRSHLLGLVTETLKKEPITTWANYLFPALGTIVTDEKYYYTIVKDNEFAVDSAKVKPFMSYFSKQ